MGKVVLELLVSDRSWKHVKLDERFSDKGNFYVKHEGKVYVYKNRKVGTPVLTKKNGKWETIGRIDISGKIFLGGKDKDSYAEYRRTPEARRKAEEFMRKWRENKK